MTGDNQEEARQRGDMGAGTTTVNDLGNLCENQMLKLVLSVSKVRIKRMIVTSESGWPGSIIHDFLAGYLTLLCLYFLINKVRTFI